MRLCVLHCQLYGSAECEKCPIPGPRGEPRCPSCRGTIYFISCTDGRASWGCRLGCPPVHIPVGNPEGEAAAAAELNEFRREKAKLRKRRSRAVLRAASAEVSR